MKNRLSLDQLRVLREHEHSEPGADNTFAEESDIVEMIEKLDSNEIKRFKKIFGVAGNIIFINARDIVSGKLDDYTPKQLLEKYKLVRKYSLFVDDQDWAYAGFSDKTSPDYEKFLKFSAFVEKFLLEKIDDARGAV